MDPNALAQLLSGLFSGAAGINQLGTAQSTAAAGAAAASPFGGQYAGYQPQLQTQVKNAQSETIPLYNNATNSANTLAGTNTAVTGDPNAVNWASTLNSGLNNQVAGIGQLNATVSGPSASQLASPSSLTSQINALATNYMSNPAIQAQYQLGLDATSRGQAASGIVGSGQQAAELEKYGQQFASGAYQQTFNDLLAGNSQAYTQGATNTQQTQAAQMGTFGQGMQQQQGEAGITQQQIQNLFGINTAATTNQQATAQNAISAAGTEGQIFNQAGSIRENANQGLTSSLGQFAGATTGSPGTAGAILSGEFANNQSALGNIGAGITAGASGIQSLGSSLSSLFSGGGNGTISDTLSSLFGAGGTGALASDTISGLSDTLGSSVAGGFSSLAAGGADTGISSGLSALMGL